MTTETATLFFALLAVVAEVVVVGVAVLAVGSRFSPGWRSALDSLRDAIGPQALGLAAAVALVCTAGSLYLSEVAHFIPCRLCWAQRFFMYPLGPVLAVAAALRWFRIRWFAIGWAALGSCVSVWHLLIERYPTLEGSTSCDPANPCSIIWVKRFGYLTIPGMALSGFLLVIVLLALARPARAVPSSDHPSSPRTVQEPVA